MDKKTHDYIKERLIELDKDRTIVLRKYERANSKKAKEAYYKLWSIITLTYDYLYDKKNAL